MLRSAVGMAHVLRSRLVMDYTTSYFPLIVLEYSEIGHIHLSIEAQCVTTLLPLGDCHTNCSLGQNLQVQNAVFVVKLDRF